MAARLLAPLTLVVLLAGCASPAPSGLVPEGSAPAAPPVPVTLEAPTFRTPVLLGSGGLSAEPNVAVTPDGRVYVTTSPFLWRSLDGGATFEAVGKDACGADLPAAGCLPGQARKDPGLDGPGDGDIAVDATGGLYWLGLFGKSGTVPFQASRDGGTTWTGPVDLADGNSTDRQWIDALPNGTLYATWRDFGARDDAESPNQLLFRRSPDGGATWDPIRVIAEDHLQGPLVHDPASGALYTAYYHGGIRIARSMDEGSTWTLHNVTQEKRDFRLRNGNPINIFPVAAVDEAGAVYVVWSEDAPETAPMGTKALSVPRIFFAASTDRGESWTAPATLSTEGRAAVFPWIVAGKPGRVAVAWYENRHGAPNEDAPDLWDVVLVESVTASGPDPAFLGGPANAEPIHLGAVCTNGGGCRQTCIDVCVPTRACVPIACVGKDRSRLDFFEVALLPDGHPILVWTADADPTTPGRDVRIFAGGVKSGTPVG